MFPSVTRSMTGFASQTGAWDDWSWTWELRSVNGKGLDLRLRLPDWIGGLEAALRARLQAAVSRGNVGLSLKLTREAGAGGFDRAALDRALAQIAAVEDIARAAGRPLAPVRATDLLTLRTGAETLDADAEAALRDRLIPWAESLTSDSVAVCHIGIMRVLMAHATGWSFAGPAPFAIKRNRLFVIEVGRDGWQADPEPIRLVAATP